MNHFPYLVAAYLAIWAGIVAYALRLGRRCRDLEEEVRELRERLRS
ncbi:MAG: CcmD family protein [Candidatus Binatia bacterium]